MLASFYKKDWEMEDWECPYYARTNGCDCCSTELQNRGDIRDEAIESIKVVLTACDYFKWDIQELVKEAAKK